MQWIWAVRGQGEAGSRGKTIFWEKSSALSASVETWTPEASEFACDKSTDERAD